MTQRLYYTDSYATTFTASLVASGQSDDGRPTVTLDRTCFYPTSGGQPFDTGMLGNLPVVEVIAADDGQVLHVLAQPLTEQTAGSLLQGKVDWPRRYDHTQQHSGQHLLSQLFYQRFGYETLSVHFSELESTLDLAVASLETAQLEEVERAANDLCYQALPIKSYFVSDAELPTINLRKPPKVSGQIRIVEIDRFDYSACGGTHVRSTAEIAPIKLTKVERRRGQVRLSFLCGGRAGRDYAHKHQLLTQAAALFGAELGEVPSLIERAQGQLKEVQREVAALHEQLLPYVAAALVQAAENIGPLRLVVQHYPDKEINALKALASQLTQQPGMVALLATTTSGKLSLIFARAQDAEPQALHMGNLLRDALAPIGGKGGGKPDFAQGGSGDAGAAEQVLAFARQQVTTTA